MANKIIVKHGPEANLSDLSLQYGELVSTDTGKLYVGNSSNVAVPVVNIACKTTLTETSLGLNQTIVGANSVTIGNNSATGNFSVAVGGSANASSMNSIAIGNNASSTGGSSVSIGMYSITSGPETLAIGPRSKALGTRSTAMGHSANSSGTSSLAIGPLSIASCNFSTAIGFSSVVRGNNSTAIGRSAVISEAETNTIWLGSSGISALKCAVNLTVTSDIRDKTDITNIDNSLQFISKLRPIQYVRNPRTEYIPDEETRSEEDQELLNKYGLCSYDKEAHAAGTKKGERKRVGLSAQEVQQALEEVYGTADYANIVSDNFHDINKQRNPIPEGVENQLTVGYSEFVPFLIGAIKELKTQNEKLKESYDTLRNEFSSLVSRIEQLESKQ